MNNSGLTKLTDQTGLIALPAPAVISGTSEYDYTYAGLPTAAKGGTSISWEVRQDTAPSSYTSSVSENRLIITNTKTTNFSANIEWRDATTKNETRPSSVSLQLYRYSASNTNPIEYGGAQTVTGTASQDTWPVSFSDLPLYDENNNIYIYPELFTEQKNHY